MSLDKVKLTNIVSQQLPEFVREDYQTFVAFIEAYYEYLDNQNYDLYELRDIDKTLDEFIVYFKNELGYILPANSNINQRFLMTQIKDQYLAKGSEASYKLLFRLLFNKEVDVIYPSKQLLRASDGKWEQDVTIFVQVNFGNVNDIVGRILKVTNPNNVITDGMSSEPDAEVEIDRYTKITDTIYELYINRNYFGNISANDRIIFGTSFDATILRTTSKVQVLQSGENFKVGQVFELINGNGTGSRIKVKTVDTNGGITSVELITFGVGYNTDFTTTLSAELGQDTEFGITVVGNNISVSESNTGIDIQGFINNYDYTVYDPSGTAFETSYVGDILREFFSSSVQQETSQEEQAIIKVTLAPVAKYPGYYRSNDGFLDDAIYIQDSRYYQAFSYVLRIDQTLESYKSFVKSSVHPAGIALFGEYDIRNDVENPLDVVSL